MASWLIRLRLYIFKLLHLGSVCLSVGQKSVKTYQKSVKTCQNKSKKDVLFLMTVLSSKLRNSYGGG